MTDPAAHAATFNRVSEHLLLTAARLQHARGEAPLTGEDVGKLFLSTAAIVLIAAVGRDNAVAMMAAYARQIAEGTEALRPH